MDPAQLHQKLDLLLKSGSQSSSSSERPRFTSRSSMDLSNNSSSSWHFHHAAQQQEQDVQDSSIEHEGFCEPLQTTANKRLVKPMNDILPHSTSTTTAADVSCQDQEDYPSRSYDGLRDCNAHSSTKPTNPSILTNSRSTSSSVTNTSAARTTTSSFYRSLHPSQQQNTNTRRNLKRSASITFDLPIGEIKRKRVAAVTEATTTLPPTLTTEAEVDSRDAPTTVMTPLHIVEQFPAPISATTTITTPASSQDRPHPVTPRQPAATTSSSKKSNRPFPHLTLSALRRPEEMIRLTDSDPNRILEKEYNLRGPGCKVIGHGAYSTVRSAIRRSDNMKVAVKSISKFDAMRARRLHRPGSKHMDEWEIMKLVENNPYTLSLFDILETDEEIHLVTELCEGGELFHAIKRKGTSSCSFRKGRFSEPQAASIAYQVLLALEDLHAHGVVHRDIKPENLLLLRKEVDSGDKIQIKLCDFGVARVHHHVKDGETASLAETASSSSDGESSPSTPGILLANKSDPPPEGCRGHCGPAVDVFSMGVTLYILLCGFPPVFCEDVVQFPEAYWEDISEEAKEVVRSMLRKDPCERITAADALKQPWIQQKHTIRCRGGSISANLELVRSHLAQTLGPASRASSKADSITPALSFEKETIGKRIRKGSIHFTSPKRSKRAPLELPMNELYSCYEKQDMKVIEDTVEPCTGEGMPLKVACT